MVLKKGTTFILGEKNGVKWAGSLEQAQAQEGMGIRLGRFDLRSTLPTP
jgi:hypothetical protein